MSPVATHRADSHRREEPAKRALSLVLVDDAELRLGAPVADVAVIDPVHVAGSEALATQGACQKLSVALGASGCECLGEEICIWERQVHHIAKPRRWRRGAVPGDA
jgi:hypothetical protein